MRFLLTDPQAEEMKSMLPNNEEVAFDWRKLIVDNLLELQQSIEPDQGLLTKLRSSGVINEGTSPLFEVSHICSI